MLGRLLAAISYLGLTGALVPLAKPDNPFVVRHARGRSCSTCCASR